MLRTSAALFLAATISTSPLLQAEAQERPQVWVVSGPLAYFANVLGGDAVDVVAPYPRDEDPAFWQPTADDIAGYQSADLILLNGADFAKWVANASLPRARLVDTSKGFADALIVEEEGITHSHGSGDEHSHAGKAFTTWLDFSQAARQAQEVAEALTTLVPDAAGDIAARNDELQAQLMTLHDEAIAIGKALDGAPLIASHPIYQYPARAYDLNIHPLVWEPDVLPTADQLADLDQLIESTNAKWMIWEDEPVEEAASAVAERGLANLVVATGNAGGPDAEFLDILRAGLDALGQLQDN